MSFTPIRILRVTGLAVVIFLGLQGCGLSTAKPKAEAAVGVFHEQLNAGNLDAIWNSTDDQFRSATPRAKFDQFIQAVHRKLGRVVKTSGAGWNVMTFNLKTRVVLQQKTEFEHGSGTEVFTYTVNGDEIKLSGYNVNSMELVTM
jgi:hypothetical protein